MVRVYKRRKYFIDKDFQAKFIIKFAMVVIISSLVIGGLLFYFNRDSTTVVIENTRVIVKPTADFILPTMIEILLLVTVISALVVSVLSLVASHRISGPLFRLKKEIDLLKDGYVGRSFNIRAKDQLQELSKSLSSMGNVLKEKHSILQEKYNALKSHLEENKFTMSDAQKERLNKILEEIEQVLNYFKV